MIAERPVLAAARLYTRRRRLSSDAEANAEERWRNMQVRRILTTLSVCSVAGFLLATSPVQAAPRFHGPATAPAGTQSKIKGLKEYEGCSPEYPEAECLLVYVFSKTKTWVLPNSDEVGGTYKKVKKIVYFYYEDGYNDGCYLEMKTVHDGYDGFYVCEGVKVEEVDFTKV